VSQVPLYDALAADYDRFVEWEGRLSHELPFLTALFEAHRVRRVLDAACGTGQHAIALGGRSDLCGGRPGRARGSGDDV
jgi:SAM-dependent methyltransferase